jgi:hypothetical protein
MRWLSLLAALGAQACGPEIRLPSKLTSKRYDARIGLPLTLHVWMALALLAVVPSARADTVNEPFVRSRAAEAVIWGMPAVNYDLMLQEMLIKTAGKVNQAIYWGRPLDWHNQTLTPNPDTIYFMAFFDTREVGPIVIEVPPAGSDGGMNANFCQRLAGAARGRGQAGRRPGQGIKLLMLPRILAQSAQGLRRAPAGHVRQLRVVPLESQESR